MNISNHHNHHTVIAKVRGIKTGNGKLYS